MNENRRKILQMLAEGKITADEAERLFAALEKEQAAPSGSGAEPQPKPKPKYIRVVVASDKKTDSATIVNIRVPIQLLRAGVKLQSLMPASAREHVDDFLRRAHPGGKALHFDLGQIKPENLEDLIDQLDDLTVDVGDKDVKVRIFCE